MKRYTVKQVARASKRHTTAVTRLVKEGKIKGEKSGRTWLVHGESLPTLAQTVKELTPKGGWHKRVAPKKRSKKSAPALGQVVEFMELPINIRTLLLQLGAKASEEDLVVLLGLV